MVTSISSLLNMMIAHFGTLEVHQRNNSVRREWTIPCQNTWDTSVINSWNCIPGIVTSMEVMGAVSKPYNARLLRARYARLTPLKVTTVVTLGFRCHISQFIQIVSAPHVEKWSGGTLATTSLKSLSPWHLPR